jgi:hypothetical protein
MTENPLLDRKFWHHFRRLRSEPIRQKSTLRYKSIACRMCQRDFFCKIYVFLALQRFFVLIPISFLWFSPRVTFFPTVDPQFWWKKWHFFVIFWCFLWFFVIFCDFLWFFDDFWTFSDFCRLFGIRGRFLPSNFGWFFVIFSDFWGVPGKPLLPPGNRKNDQNLTAKIDPFRDFFRTPPKSEKVPPPPIFGQKSTAYSACYFRR